MAYRPSMDHSFWTAAHGSGSIKRNGISWGERLVKVKYSDGYVTTYTFDELDYAKCNFGKGKHIYKPDR